MKNKIPNEVQTILVSYQPDDPGETANSLRSLWLQYKPKSIEGIKAEQRELQETVGIPVPILKSIGKEIGKEARKHVKEFIPLMRSLWDVYGREGRVVATIPLGAMELVEPDTIMPLVMELCRTCFTWEDADQLAMGSLEPIIRKKPQQWLPAIEPWLSDDNKWVRRTGVTVLARLQMKCPEFTAHCLSLTERLLHDSEMDVKRAVSFSIRLSARGDIIETQKFLRKHIPPKNPASAWVLCDSIRSMTKKFLPEFTFLLPQYEKWAKDPALSSRDLRSIESAIRILRKAN